MVLILFRIAIGMKKHFGCFGDGACFSIHVCILGARDSSQISYYRSNSWRS
jgi:hypothetical protein